MICINDLPDEVLEFVLSYLPPYLDFESCSLVSKRWHNAVENVRHRSKINFYKGLSDYSLCWKTDVNNLYQKDSNANNNANIINNNNNIKISISPQIAGRFSHACVIYQNSMYVFGGGSSTDTTFNDLWRYDLSNREWIRPITKGTYPSPKGSASMVCYQNKLILFGGWRYPSFYPPHQTWCLFDELHFYDVDENRWIMQQSVQSPPPMAGHSATIHNDEMVIFGGFQIHNDQNTSSNDVWLLDLSTFQWRKPQIIGNQKPAPRYGQFQIGLDDDNLLIMGGCGGINNLFSDAWLLSRTKNDCFQWCSIPIKNRKFSAAHMWSSPACKVGNKLVVLGPTPNVPPDFQVLKQHRSHRQDNFQLPRPQNHQQILGLERNRLQAGEHRRRPVQPPLQPPPPPPQNPDNRNNLNNYNLNKTNNLAPPPLPSSSSSSRLFSPQSSKSESINRLQRNLALRARENDVQMPQRFYEQQDIVMNNKMAAFHVQHNDVRNASKERQQERLRRLDEKLNQFRNAKQQLQIQQQQQQQQNRLEENKQKNLNEKISGEPKPKRVKKNLLAMFVCDISNILSNQPFIEWLEYKNYGILQNAPERLIFSSMVAGRSELILFGGVQKESLYDQHHKVSNSLYFLTIPKEII